MFSYRSKRQLFFTFYDPSPFQTVAFPDYLRVFACLRFFLIHHEVPISTSDHNPVPDIKINAGYEVFRLQQDESMLRLDAGNLGKEGLDKPKRLVEVFPYDQYLFHLHCFYFLAVALVLTCEDVGTFYGDGEVLAVGGFGAETSDEVAVQAVLGSICVLHIKYVVAQLYRIAQQTMDLLVCLDDEIDWMDQISLMSCILIWLYRSRLNSQPLQESWLKSLIVIVKRCSMISPKVSSSSSLFIVLRHQTPSLSLTSSEYFRVFDFSSSITNCRSPSLTTTLLLRQQSMLAINCSVYIKMNLCSILIFHRLAPITFKKFNGQSSSFLMILRSFTLTALRSQLNFFSYCQQRISEHSTTMVRSLWLEVVLLRLWMILPCSP